MTSLSTFALGAVLYAVPGEYVIDFGAEAVPFAYEMVLNVATRDGGGLENLKIEFGKRQDPDFCRDFLADALRDNDLAVRPGPGNRLVVIGSAKGNKVPVKWVTLRSDKLIPVQVRWAPLPPPKK